MCEDVIANGGSFARDPLWTAIEAAGRCATTDPRTLLDSMRERLGQYLAALTDRRFQGIRWSGPESCQIIAAQGAALELEALPLADQDVIYIGLRLALAEKVAAVSRRPLLVDEPSVLVDGAHRGLFIKMLKSLGATTQVVVRAFDAPPASAVDHVARVGAAA
jgi:hypothetical protein